MLNHLPADASMFDDYGDIDYNKSDFDSSSGTLNISSSSNQLNAGHSNLKLDTSLGDKAHSKPNNSFTTSDQPQAYVSFYIFRICNCFRKYNIAL
jgi:hypothetical protein